MTRFDESSVFLFLATYICSLLPTAFSFGHNIPLSHLDARGEFRKLAESTDSVNVVDPAATSITGRREILQHTASALVTLSTFSLPLPSSAEGVSVLRSKGCYRGEGEACDELAEGNELIRSLQRKSAENREMNDREALNAYNMKNFPDFFASLNPPKYLVKQPDGSFGVYTDAELAELKKLGKITVENPKTKGGKFMDLTQKPMLVLVE